MGSGSSTPTRKAATHAPSSQNRSSGQSSGYVARANYTTYPRQVAASSSTITPRPAPVPTVPVTVTYYNYPCQEVVSTSTITPTPAPVPTVPADVIKTFWISERIIPHLELNKTSLELQCDSRHRVTINHNRSNNMVEVKGPEPLVTDAKTIVQRFTTKLQIELKTKTLSIEYRHHQRIRNLLFNINHSNVMVNMQGDTVKLEGCQEHVDLIVTKINDLLEQIKLEERESKEVFFPRSSHRLLVGPDGENVRELTKEIFKDVTIDIRDFKNSRADLILIQGQRDQVKQCYELIVKLCAEVTGMNQTTITVPKMYHGKIIGKDGENIKKISNETHTRIQFPERAQASELVTIAGMEWKDIKMAKSRIESLYIPPPSAAELARRAQEEPLEATDDVLAQGEQIYVNKNVDKKLLIRELINQERILRGLPVKALPNINKSRKPTPHEGAHSKKKEPTKSKAKENDDEKNCEICFDAKIDSFMVPCGHSGFCYSCANKCLQTSNNICPKCRGMVLQVSKIYY